MQYFWRVDTICTMNHEVFPGCGKHTTYYVVFSGFDTSYTMQYAVFRGVDTIYTLDIELFLGGRYYLYDAPRRDFGVWILILLRNTQDFFVGG